MRPLRRIPETRWSNNDQREGLVAPTADPFDVWASDNWEWAATSPSTAAVPDQNGRLGETRTTRSILNLLRQYGAPPARFPRALSSGETGVFCRWVCGPWAKETGLSITAISEIKAVFRSRPGRRVYDIYLNDPELQRLFPLALLPIGQRNFVGWLLTYGRADQNLTEEEILWFLHESAEDLEGGVWLTYLLSPLLQKHFPLALTKVGFKLFKRWLSSSYGQFIEPPEIRLPALLSRKDQRSLIRNIANPTVPPPKAALEGVNMLSHFCTPLGIQQAALWAKAALERCGIRTSCRDIPLSRGKVPTDRADWLGLEIFPVTILNQAPTPYFISGYDRSGLYRRRNVFRIAYWNWELETIPDEWLEVAPFVDEIWSPTPFVAKTMRSKMPVPVYEMLPGVELGEIEPINRAALKIPEDHCVFLCMFDFYSQIHRKNPLAAIRAFESAFGANDKATLVIKTTGGDRHASELAVLEAATRGKNIILIDELVSRAAAYGFIAMCDCFVSLHRSEGFGLGLAESMLMAKPVIATAYSGNLAFMSQDNSMLVDYQIVEITEERPLYTKGNFWAEPSVDDAARYMRHVYEHRRAVTERAIAVQPEIQRLLSLEAAGHRMLSRLQQIVAG
jgi:glycosyltransferase involved in cell wall biosynthesis